MTTIEKLTRPSLPSFYDLFSKVIRTDFDDYSQELKNYFLEQQYKKSNFALWIQKPIKVTFVALDENGDVVGFIVGKKIYGGVGFIEWVGVEESQRGKGIGKKLIKHYESFARENSAHRIELFTKNPAVYEKVGYSILTRRQNGYFGLDRYHLENELRSWQNVIPEVGQKSWKEKLKQLIYS